MEIILEVSLMLAHDEEEDDEDEGILLEKRLDLPFAPYENLDLLLPGAERVMNGLSESDLESMAEWIIISPELGAGVFRLAHVAFDVEAGVFRAETDSISTDEALPQDIERFAQHLVEAFGFVRQEDDEDD